MTRFPDKVKALLRERHITLSQFEMDTGIHRRFFYYNGKRYHNPRKATLMAIAYYLGMKGELLVADTDAEDIWYR